MQTTNNTLSPSGDPFFLDVAVQTGSLTNTGVNLALERLETGSGAIVNQERICYLAVERAGCQALDFSSLGGPTTPITMNAVLGGQNTDGWGNGCTTGEGATFDAGCFSSTPIALASLRSRRGGNGAVLRRCSVNANEIILTVDEDRVSNNERNHIDELTSAIGFSSIFTTPVTLNQAKIKQSARTAIFEWQTSSESFHLGFHLWGEVDGEWIQLNRHLIKSDSTDHAGLRNYKQRIKLKAQQVDKVTRYGISSVDTSGSEEFYGPFEAGQQYGKHAINEAVDWQDTRNKFNKQMRQQGYHLVNGRWRKLKQKKLRRLTDKKLGVDDQLISFTVKQNGIHAIAYEDLHVLNNDWLDTPLKQIALTLNGKAVPRHIISKDEKFNAGDIIIFAGQLPAKEDAVYLWEYHYRLRLDPGLALNANEYDGYYTGGIETASTESLQTLRLTDLKAYSAALNNGDPWYDTRLLGTSAAVSQSYSFELSEQYNLSLATQIEVRLFGGVDFPGDANLTPDHHVQIYTNGELLEDTQFDGLTESVTQIDIPAGLLKQGNNTIEVRLPADTSYSADAVFIDTIDITVHQNLNSKQSYDFLARQKVSGYRTSITNQTADYHVFSYQQNGALSLINNFMQQNDEIIFKALPGQKNSPRYAVGDQSSWLRPNDIVLVEPQRLHKQPADYLIVAHPNFINQKLDDFANQKTAEGHQARIINWLEIVETYGFGNNTPYALDNFLNKASQEFGYEYVLLVGGNTYDYLNVTGHDVINFIPTHYRPVGIFGYAPSDTPYADLNKNGLPDIAIGRWPVRSTDDLTWIIKKTSDWQQNISTQQYQDALLIAQPNDNRNLNFVKHMDGRVAIPLQQMSEFDQIDKVYLQNLIDSDISDPVAVARNTISEKINSGTELVSFAGHASYSAWGFQSIVDTQFIQTLNNSSQPTLVMPLACYTTYYESPSTNTLAHQWLFAGDKGAAAIHGASVLGGYRENAVFAERYLNHAKHSETIGQAILKAKQDMSANNQMVNNWALLGDPSLPIR